MYPVFGYCEGEFRVGGGLSTGTNWGGDGGIVVVIERGVEVVKVVAGRVVAEGVNVALAAAAGGGEVAIRQQW